jgi:hypothetical protein
VTGLATAVACLHDGFEGPSSVDIHRNARGECAKGCALLQGSRQWGEPVSGRRRMDCVGERSESSV